MKIKCVPRRVYLRECIGLLVLYIVTFGVLLPVICRNWPFSVYYQPGNETITLKAVHTESANRLRDAQVYFKAEKASSRELNIETWVSNSLLGRKSNTIDKPVWNISVGIITMRRKGNPGYLTQTAARLHSISKSVAYKIPLFICNVDLGTRNNTEAVLLGHYMPVVHRFDLQYKSTKSHTIYEKEKEDYVFCLHQILKYGTTHVALFEDDVLPYINFLSTLTSIMENKILHKVKKEDKIENEDKWLFLKLYYPEKWEGFSWELYHIIELIGIATFGGAIFVIFGRILSCFQSRLLNQRSRFFTLLYIQGAIYFMIIAILMGRPHIEKLRTFHNQLYRVRPAPGCCTQAVLYPSHEAARLADYLSSVKCSPQYGVDLAMDDYANKNGYHVYSVEPNLVKHIGLISTLKPGKKSVIEFI